MIVKMHTINTTMGISSDWLFIPELTEENVKELNRIGSQCNSVLNMQTYLNSINSEMSFAVYQTVFDDGSFKERFIVSVVK